MKKTTYSGKSRQDLVRALMDKREALSSFRFGTAGGKAKNTKTGRDVRKEIARIMTELNK